MGLGAVFLDETLGLFPLALLIGIAGDVFFLPCSPLLSLLVAFGLRDLGVFCCEGTGAEAESRGEKRFCTVTAYVVTTLVAGGPATSAVTRADVVVAGDASRLRAAAESPGGALVAAGGRVTVCAAGSCTGGGPGGRTHKPRKSRGRL